MLPLLALLAAPPWQAGTAEGTIAERIAPPPGFTRIVAEPGSFAAWLRALPVLPGRPEVLLHDGSKKANQTAHHVVLALDVGSADLQQCADAVIRLRAEWLRDSGRSDEVCFRFTSGHAASWRDWRSGMRPVVRGAAVRFAKSAAADDSYASFRAYLDRVFTYAGSASLEQELVAATGPVRIGDVLIQGGFPGHVVVVVDAALGAEGAQVVLLAQSYMPAQQIHVLAGPWYTVRAGEPVLTPEWRFSWNDLRRFPETGCAR